MYWNTLYATRSMEEMHWYYPGLDPDLEKALKDHNITSGSFLDVGTGPGTQAVELAKRRFSVTGTDISKAAIRKVSKLSDRVHFLQDDILDSGLTRQFDYIFDRGCFHTLNSNERSGYLKAVTRLLHADGILFIKCFSDKEPETGSGPYRFSKNMLEHIFGACFDVLNIYDTEYQGTLNPLPKALFGIMRKRKTNP